MKRIFGSSDLIPSINSKQLSEALTLTAGATAAVATSTSTVYKNTTNSFMFGGVFTLSSWTTATVLRSCLSGGAGYQLEVVVTTGIIRVTLNSTVYDSTIPLGGVASQLLANSTHSILAVVTVGTTTTTVSFYLDGYLLNTTAAQANVDVTNTNIYYLGGTSAARYFMTIYDVYDYNRAPTAAEVLDLYRNGIAYADKWGSQTAIASDTAWTGASAATPPTGWTVWFAAIYTIVDDGSPRDTALKIENDGTNTSPGMYKTYSSVCVIGRRYKVSIWVKNVTSTAISIGIGPSVGTYTYYNANSAETAWKLLNIEFVATGVNVCIAIRAGSASAGHYGLIDDIAITPLGATLALESSNIQPSPGQWLDSSTNKLHALQPLTGSSLTQPKRDFEIRGTTSWTASHEAQHIVGIAQNVLPPNAYIQSIVGVITGADVEDIIIGDGSDTDRWVTITTGLTTGTVSFTIANHISDGSHEQLVVDPDADCTMSIEWTIKGVIL